MGASVFGFNGYVTVPPPSGGFWRVSHRHDPFDPPSPAPELGTHPRDDDGHRFDDPAGAFKTLYCATEPDGALGECLGDFVFSAPAAQRIETFLLTEPDEGFDEDYQRPLRSDDIAGFGWKLAHAPAQRTARLIETDHWRTYRAAPPKVMPALLRYRIKRFDRHTLLDERRYVTRTLAGVYRADATDLATGVLRAAGLRYISRLPPAWECWALWEPLPLDADRATIESVSIQTPQLHRAADLLEVALVLPH